jgi:two-component sensor histidine kinase
LAEIAYPSPVAGAAVPASLPRRNAPAIVIGLALALIFVIFAIFAFLCVQGYATTLSQAQSKAQSAADVVAEETEWMLGGGQALLRYLAGAAAPAGGTQVDRSAIAAALANLPVPASFGVYDVAGKPVANLGSASLPPTISETEIFKSIAAGQDSAISMQMADAATGAPIFVLAQKLPGASFAGVAVLTVAGDVLKELWEPQKLGAESTVSILRSDGWIVARYPAIPQALNSGQSPPFTTLKDAETGTYISDRSPVDRVARVVGFHRLPSLGVVAIASVSRDAAVAGLWTAIITVLWLMGPIAIGLLVFALITARMLRTSERTQAKLAAAVEHNQTLFREIHHRVKNNLQSVASLLQMQPIAREIKMDMGQRLAAMSAVHEHIYRSNNFSTVRVKTYLETLIENIRGGADPKVRVVAQLDDVSVDKDAATPLGLIVNEVLSNAFKHAFPDGREGLITVQLERQVDGRGRLTVADNGVGFDPDKPVKGIGQRLIRALTEQIGGVSTMASGNGSTFTLTFPLAKTE